VIYLFFVVSWKLWRLGIKWYLASEAALSSRCAVPCAQVCSPVLLRRLHMRLFYIMSSLVCWNKICSLYMHKFNRKFNGDCNSSVCRRRIHGNVGGLRQTRRFVRAHLQCNVNDTFALFRSTHGVRRLPRTRPHATLPWQKASLADGLGDKRTINVHYVFHEDVDDCETFRTAHSMSKRTIRMYRTIEGGSV